MDFTALPPLSLFAGKPLSLSRSEVSEFMWAFRFGAGGEVTLVIESAHWRLVGDSRVLLADGDHNHQFGLDHRINGLNYLANELSDGLVQAVELSPVGDLILRFSNDRSIEVLVSSAGYEGWHVYGPENSHTFAIGGGEICRDVI